MDFADWLNRKMIEREMNPTQLARKSGLSRQAIYYYLSGNSKKPDEFALQKLAKVLDVTIQEIYRAAGSLPQSVKDDDEVIESIKDEIRKMSKDEQREALVMIRTLNNLRKKK